EAGVRRSDDRRSAGGESGRDHAAARSHAGGREDERLRHVGARRAPGRPARGDAVARAAAEGGRDRRDVDGRGAAVARRRVPRGDRATREGRGELTLSATKTREHETEGTVLFRAFVLS